MQLLELAQFDGRYEGASSQKAACGTLLDGGRDRKLFKLSQLLGRLQDTHARLMHREASA